MSWLWGATPADPNAPTFHPVASRYPENEIRGTLEQKDIEWMTLGGFVTETQTYYNFLEDGTFVMCQVIHSSIGVWYPTVQFTFKLYNPTTKKQVWRSTNLSNFAVGTDKRTCKADNFSISYTTKPGTDFPEKFTIFANVAEDVQVTLDISRPADTAGWKIGNGPQGGFSYYGTDLEKPDGLVYHSFWPRTICDGLIVHSGNAITAKGPGMYVHAVLGMRPNLIASRWNFVNFQSTEHNGISVLQSEHKTLEANGLKGPGSGGVKVNMGSVVANGKLVCVTVETILPGGDAPKDPKANIVSRAIHHNPIHDPDTTYDQPQELEFVWGGPSSLEGVSGHVSANLKVAVGTPTEPQGLVEKVDVLAEIPAVVKAVISYVAGTKPYIYQWHKPATLNLTLPEGVIPGQTTLEVPGTVYTEASFVS